MENLYKNIQKDLYDKSEETRLDFNQILKSFEQDIYRKLEKKAEISEVNNLTSMKTELNQALVILQNKVNISEYEILKLTLEKVSKDLNEKIDYEKFDNFINEIRISMDDIQKDLMVKANIKEILNLLKNKPDLNEVNSAITRITEELDQKCPIEKVK